MDLSLRLLADSKQAQQALGDFQSAALAAGKVLKDLAVESVKAFADAERVQRQLRLAAGSFTDALNAQADAMKEKFAVDDDAIRQMDVLLLRYGAAPSQIEGATEAVLNYAAATGKDATQAMEMLIRGVESGNGSLGKMGVNFKTTGKFTEDLASAVEALSKKFGGAGEEDAKGLDGRMRSVSLATDDLKKTLGGMFDELDRRMGLLDKLAAGLNKVNAQLQDEGLLVYLGLKSSKLDTKGQLENTGGMFGLFDKDDPRFQTRLADAQTRDYLAKKQTDELMSFLIGQGAIPGTPYGPEEPLPTTPMGGDHAVGHDDKGAAARAKKLQDEFEQYLNAENEYLDKKWAMDREAEKKQAEHLTLMLEGVKAYEKEELEHEEKALEAKRKLADAELDIEFEKNKRIQAENDKHNAEMDRKFKRQVEQWRAAGDQMGAALVNAIGEQLMRLAEGGDVDPAETVGDVVAVILGIAGFAVGTYFGAPQVGGAIGGLAGGLAKQGIVSAYGRKRNTKHDGGWIERYHDGGWPLGSDEVPAILQAGERVLSRREVSAMGGPGGVDRAARGGPMQVNITAMDAYSFQEQFGGDGRGGRGVFNAIRIGRGDLVPLFG